MYRIIQTSQRLEMCILSHEHARLPLLRYPNEEEQRQGRIRWCFSQALGTSERHFAGIQARA